MSYGRTSFPHFYYSSKTGDIKEIANEMTGHSEGSYHWKPFVGGMMFVLRGVMTAIWLLRHKVER